MDPTLKSKLAGSLVDEVLGKKKEVKGIQLVVARTDELDAEGMRQLIDTLKAKMGSGVIVLANGKPDQITFRPDSQQLPHGLGQGKLAF